MASSSRLEPFLPVMFSRSPCDTSARNRTVGTTMTHPTTQTTSTPSSTDRLESGDDPLQGDRATPRSFDRSIVAHVKRAASLSVVTLTARLCVSNSHSRYRDSSSIIGNSHLSTPSASSDGCKFDSIGRSRATWTFTQPFGGCRYWPVPHRSCHLRWGHSGRTRVDRAAGTGAVPPDSPLGSHSTRDDDRHFSAVD